MPKLQFNPSNLMPRNLAEEDVELIFEFQNGWSVLAKPYGTTGNSFFMWVKHPKLIDGETGEAEYHWRETSGSQLCVGDAELLTFALKFAVIGSPRKQLLQTIAKSRRRKSSAQNSTCVGAAQ